MEITINGNVTLTTTPPDTKNSGVIVCDWLDWRPSGSHTRFEWLVGDMYTIWYVNGYSVIRYPGRKMAAEDIERLKGRITPTPIIGSQPSAAVLAS